MIDGEEKLGEMPLEKALERASEKGLDLVEVAPLAKPPVCKIMDFGNHLYNLKKKEKKQKKSAKQTETKTIRLSIRTESHDLEVKARKARKFLESRHPLKVVLIFRGRELAHKDLAIEKMKTFQAMLEDVCTIEQMPKKQGYQMIMILNPLK